MRAVATLMLLFLVAPEVYGFGKNLIAVMDYDELLVKCTYQLVKKYFSSGESLSGSVLAMSLTGAPMHIEDRILQALHMDSDIFWSLIVRHPKKPSPSMLIMNEKPQAYLVVLDNLDDVDMDDVFADWKSMPNWNPQAQFVVFLSAMSDTEEEMTEVMAEIAFLFMNRKIFNINVISQTEEDGRIYAKTAFPYEPDNQCGTRAIAFHTLDTCDFEEDESTEVIVEEHSRGLFLDKIPKDLSGCPLVAYTRAWEPYMFVEDGRLKGIEWMLVQTIADRLHIGIQIVIQNRTLFHIFQALLDGEIDIAIGGIDEDPNLSHLVSASVPYLQDDLTWCVTKAKKALHWLNFLQVFSAGTYATYFTFIILNALVIHTIRSWLRVRRERLPTLIIILLGIAISQSAPLWNLTPSLRICLMMSLTAALLLGSVYNSFMVSSLTSPSSLPQIKKTVEIFEHKMSVTGSVDIIRHLDKEDDIFHYIREEFTMCYNIEECLQRAAYDVNLAIAVSRQYSIHNPRIPRDNLYCFVRDENIYTYLVTMLMPKKFHLFHQINPIIQYVIESGHLLKWTRDLERERALKANRRIDEGALKSINVGQISGIFAFTAILIVFSCLIVAIEIVVHRIYMRGTRVKLVKFLHRSFS